MVRRTVLDVIEIPQPCSRSWDQMRGDERTRFCDACGLHVHNLSVMSTEEAARHVSAPTDRVCVSFERTSDGRVRTLDYQAPTREGRKGMWVLIGLFGAIVIGCADALFLDRRTTRVMGAIPATRVLGKVCPTTAPATRPATRPAECQTDSAQ